MDQRGEKEEHSSQESSDHRKGDAAAAVTVSEGVHGESTDQRDDDGGYEAETAGVIKEQVDEAVEEAAPAPFLAHPRSLLQLLLRACAGCLVGLLHGYCSDDGPKPAADDVAAVAFVESSPQEGKGAAGDDDDKAADSVSVQDHRLICRYSVL